VIPSRRAAPDSDPTTAAATRRATLDRVTADGMLAAGMHPDFPGFGHVETAGEGDRFIAAPFDCRA
jgi:hypothetical protein